MPTLPPMLLANKKSGRNAEDVILCLKEQGPIGDPLAPSPTFFFRGLVHIAISVAEIS